MFYKRMEAGGGGGGRGETSVFVSKNKHLVLVSITVVVTSVNAVFFLFATHFKTCYYVTTGDLIYLPSAKLKERQCSGIQSLYLLLHILFHLHLRSRNTPRSK